MRRLVPKSNIKLALRVCTGFVAFSLAFSAWGKTAVAGEMEFTYVHPYPRGPMSYLKGRVEVEGNAYEDYRATVYIHVPGEWPGWWTKPTWDEPCTFIKSNGIWECELTGDHDYLADEFAAFLVPNSICETLPLGSGEPNLDPNLFDYPYVIASKFDLRANLLWIEFTYIPPYGSDANLCGRIGSLNPEDNIDPDDYKVLVYIYVSGWWTKPTWDDPLIPIDPNGAWCCDITTAGTDCLATKIIAFLVPNDYNTPPLGFGQQLLPSELYLYPYAEAPREIIYRTVDFAAYKWLVKQSNDANENDKIDPGPNYFTDCPNDVWVDSNGLHLSIVQKSEKWYCSEVIADANVGYGTYIFTVEDGLNLFNENIIAGLFTWDGSAPQYYRREIDFEFSRWQDPDEPNNAQFVIQPHYNAGNRHRFNIEDHPDEITTHELTWRPSGVYFQSYYGSYPLVNENDRIESWCYTGEDIPPEGAENPRINFYLANGYPPSDMENAEIVVRSFQYLPTIIAKIDIEPDVLNLASKGRWITCYISLCGVFDVAPDGVFLKNEIKAEQTRFDEEKQVLVAKFNRSEVQQMLAELNKLGDVELTITGQLVDGTRFEGTDTIRVIAKGNEK